MSYREVIKYLESFINYEKILLYPYKESLKLERVRDFLGTIANPQDSLRCIHVAGSKGKGSTCAFIAYILRQAGYRIGLYTSPHLSDFRERIRILRHRLQKASGSRCQIGFAHGARLDSHQLQDDFEGMISKESLSGLVMKTRRSIEKYNKDSKYGALSFFEVYTSLAFVYFKEQKVDFAVLETGLGGRLDATNVVNPLVSAITPISYEHTQKLGNTLREITVEKAGIIKRSPVISAPQEEEVAEVIRNRCRKMNARLYEVGKDISYKKTKEGFNVKGILGDYANLKTRILGEHQLVNASVAIGVIEALRSYNFDIGINSIRSGLYNTVWPGRCEVISASPMIVLDGAQNVASASVLKKMIKENFKYKKLILVLGISSDKDKKGICSQLYDLADTIILTKADNPRAAGPKILAEYFKGKQMHVTGSAREAKRIALKIAGVKDLILVTGSLFVVGEIRELFK